MTTENKYILSRIFQQIFPISGWFTTWRGWFTESITTLNWFQVFSRALWWEKEIKRSWKNWIIWFERVNSSCSLVCGGSCNTIWWTGTHRTKKCTSLDPIAIRLQTQILPTVHFSISVIAVFSMVWLSLLQWTSQLKMKQRITKCHQNNLQEWYPGYGWRYRSWRYIISISNPS